MIFPLEELTKFKGGMYEITAAASRRAYQLAKIDDEELLQDKEISENTKKNLEVGKSGDDSNSQSDNEQ